MATAIWPIELFIPQEVSVDPVHRNTSTTTSTSGISQTVSNGAGRWKVTFTNVPVYGDEAILQWRALDMETEGKLKPILVPAWDFPRSPYVINGFGSHQELLNSVTPHSDETPHDDETPYASGKTTFEVKFNVSAGQSFIRINKISNALLRVGHRFSIGERFYQIKEIVAQSSIQCNCYIWPPLREDILAGQTCNFDNPYVRVKFASNTAMNLPLTINHYSFPTLEFVEDV